VTQSSNKPPTSKRLRRVKPLILERRTFLRGLGGVAIGLPLLESMLHQNGLRLASAQQDGLPLRYGIVFAGQALGGDEYPKNLQRINGESFEEEGHFIVPPSFGENYTSTTPLAPLEGLRSEFSLVSNLSIPYNKNSTEGNDVPAAGAYRDFHGGGKSPLLCGVRSTEAEFRCNGITSDQALAEQLRGATAIDSLVYRAQPSWYLSGSSFSGRQYISYGPNAERIEAQTSPQVAFQSLFDNFGEPTDGAPVDDYRRRARLSVLDLVGNKREQVLLGLGQNDRQRIERHYDELRDLERRIDAATTPQGSSCVALDDPGADPVVGGDNAGATSDEIATNTGYSNEALRARIMADLVHMALVCDLTRVFTLQLTVFQSHMNVFPFTSDMGMPIRADLHEVGHNGDANNRGQLAVSTCLKWHIEHYAYLLTKMRDTPEGDRTLLDSSAVFFMPEAGHGTQLNDGVSQNATHSVEQMVLLLAGRASGLSPGRHVDGTGVHPVQVLLSGMRAAGFEGDNLGEVSGYFPGVFG
jgi:hypothetical protein